MTSRIAGRSYPEKKKAYFQKFNDLLDKYNKILVVLEDNVQSMQMHQIRIALRGVAEVIMGKNTMMKKVITDRAARTESERDKQLHQKLVTDGLLRNNVGLILTNGDLNSILKVIETNRVQAPARQGAISPCEVVIPAGNTGMEPTKTSFFQALNLQTKISKGTVELVKDVTILNVGDRVGSSEAALLQMLKINPFYYGLEVQHVYDNGAVYGLDILRITDEDMANKFGEGLGNVTALSLALGFTTQASLPHVLTNAFKDIFSVSLGTSYDFEAFGAKALKQAIKEGKPIGGAAPAPKGAAPKAEAAEEKKPAKKEEPEEEEDADMGFGLFD